MTLVTTVWFVIAFTATEKAFWNSGLWFPLFYAGAAIVALKGIRSIVSILAFILALLPLVFIAIVLFAH
ncbi:MAG: hypothetical protein JO201_00950 [Verrucomicrobia bacterium]|nr:hypothetical protein [Verrucomicrobiota bacterium]